MDRKQQIAFADNAEQRHEANVARWQKNAAYQAAMSKYDARQEPKRTVKHG
ncbi:hypothetical protein [Azospirillum sp. INR13]|uniref:hypothetical protein n=1 Tax=Azospirillum sp. INR13 TaxID=2596919 RepID=UPI0018922BA0|nr:hypothetical protein [Azospirillum sp. INR13]